MRLCDAAAFAVIAALASTSVVAQPQSTSRERPVIGLVLSGGGARGGAHVGVIKALEELRVPVDLVAGTSIGATVGGLYASGMTVQEIEDFINGIDWDAAFLNTTPRRLQSFRRKHDDTLFFLDTRPGLDEEGFSLPAGVVQGQVIDTVMARVMLPVAAVDDFDKLALPFRAVASDLETGEAVVLSGGNLSRALRASMSVPAALTPIEIDGHLLVDGGIVMNLPVEVAKSMGAEHIIAIDISEKLAPREEIRSVVDVTSQLTSMLTVRGTREQLDLLGDGDILLTPTFADDYSSVSFARLAETIDAGYDAVMQNRALFERYQLSAEDYAAYHAARPDPRITELPTIDFIRLRETAPLAESVIRARITDITLGQPLDLDALETSLSRIYGLGTYQNVRYALVRDGAQAGLDLDLIERSWGPSYVQLGLRYSSATQTNARFGLAASYLRTGVNSLGGEWRATFVLGDEPGFFADWYQPVGPKALTFVDPAFIVDTSLRNVFEDNTLAAEVRLRTVAFELGAGREFMDWGEVRGGFRVGGGDTTLRVGDPAFVPYDGFHLGEVFARFSVDTFDNLSFPREGTFASVEWRGTNHSALGGDGDYQQLVTSVSHARSWGRHALVTSFRYDATISGETPLFRLFELGGFRDLSGYAVDQLSGEYVTRLGASYYRRIGNLALFPAFVGASVEVGNVWDSRDDISLPDSIWAGSIWAGVDTPAGPVFLAYGSAEGGQDAFYVYMGRLF